MITLKKNLKVIELKNYNCSSFYSVITNKPPISSAKKFLWNILDLWNFSSYNQIKRILENEKPDMVHTNGITGISSSIFSAIKRTQIPHVHTLHNFELISRWGSLFRNGKLILNFNPLDRIYIKFMCNVSSDITAVISPSNFVMNYHKKLGYFKNSKCFVIPHGTKLNIDVRPKEGVGKEFLFLGRITKKKGAYLTIQAFKKIKEKNVKLHILGDGPDLETIKDMGKQDERIQFHGYVNEQQKKQFFENCSYAIFPSIWYENFPLTIYEFMSNGLPVLASDLGAIPELVKDGQNGYLFNSGDFESLRKTIEKLLADEIILNKLSKNAIESSKKFPIGDQFKRTMEVYENIIR